MPRFLRRHKSAELLSALPFLGEWTRIKRSPSTKETKTRKKEKEKERSKETPGDGGLQRRNSKLRRKLEKLRRTDTPPISYSDPTPSSPRGRQRSKTFSSSPYSDVPQNLTAAPPLWYDTAPSYPRSDQTPKSVRAFDTPPRGASLRQSGWSTHLDWEVKQPEQERGNAGVRRSSTVSGRLQSPRSPDRFQSLASIASALEDAPRDADSDKRSGTTFAGSDLNSNGRRRSLLQSNIGDGRHLSIESMEQMPTTMTRSQSPTQSMQVEPDCTPNTEVPYDEELDYPPQTDWPAILGLSLVEPYESTQQIVLTSPSGKMVIPPTKVWRNGHRNYFPPGSARLSQNSVVEKCDAYWQEVERERETRTTKEKTAS